MTAPQAVGRSDGPLFVHPLATMVIPQSFYANVTLIDVQLASAYYPILVDLAKHKHCLTNHGCVHPPPTMKSPSAGTI